MGVVAPAQRNDHSRGDAEQPQPLGEFVRSTSEHVEPYDYDETRTVKTSTQGPYSLKTPATGYFRSVFLETVVSGASTTGAAPTLHPDFPFNVYDELGVNDVGGAPLIETLTGYEHMVIGKWGGYDFLADPKAWAGWVAPDANGNSTFQMRIPVAISRDGTGALSNMNQKQLFKVPHRLAASTDMYTANAPTTLPNIRTRAHYEGWLEPGDGNKPPHPGVTQYWSKEVHTIAATGSQAIILERVGASIRNLILIYRDANGVRQDSMIPDQIQWYVDNRPAVDTSRIYRKTLMSQRFGYAASAFDTGVEVWTYDHDSGHPGMGEMYDHWLSTGSGTKLRLVGNFPATGTVTVLINDVVVPAEATSDASAAAA
jgi:hypothetical protein